MRQAGVLAAAGLVALCEMVDRLAVDHNHAQSLARGLAQIAGLVVRPEMTRTNMVFFELEDGLPLAAEEVTANLRQRANIWLGATGSRSFRAVTHYWIGRREVEMLLDSLTEIIAEANSR
jgi:threonine aldolase